MTLRTSESRTLKPASSAVADAGVKLCTYKRFYGANRIVRHGFSVEYWFTQFSKQRIIPNQRIIVLHETTFSALMAALPF